MHRHITPLLIILGAILLAPSSTVMADQAIASGGIGLTRSAWEAEHGTGELVDPVSPLLGDLYAYEGGTYVVAFEGSKSEADAVVTYIEVTWDDDGIDFRQARETVNALLPTDAESAEAYFAPPPSDGPIALQAFRYVSPSLDAIPYGTTTLTANVLVIYHSRVEPSQNGHEMHEMRVNIMAEIPPG